MMWLFWFGVGAVIGGVVGFGIGKAFCGDDFPW